MLRKGFPIDGNFDIGKKVCGRDIKTECAVCGCASQDYKILGKSVVHKLQYAGLSYAVIQYGVHRNSRKKDYI